MQTSRVVTPIPIQFKALYRTLPDQIEGDLQAAQASMDGGSVLIIAGTVAAQDNPVAANAVTGYGSGLVWAGITLKNYVQKTPQKLLQGLSFFRLFAASGLGSTSLSAGSFIPSVAGVFFSMSLLHLYEALKGRESNSPPNASSSDKDSSPTPPMPPPTAPA